MKDTSINEQALIGSLLNMAESRPITEMYRYVVQLEPSDFTMQLCGTVFDVIRNAVMKESAFDVSTIYGEIERRDPKTPIKFTDVGALHFNQGGYSAIDSHLKAVVAASMARKAIKVLQNTITALSQSEDVLAAVGLAESAIEQIMQKAHGESSELTHVSDLMINWVQRANDQCAGVETEVGVTTGFNGLDEMLGDDLMKAGSVAVIGANPGKGKTAMMISMSMAAAEQYPDRSVHVYSLEMPSEQIIDRMMGSAVQNKKPKHFNDTDWGLISNHMERLKGTNLYVADNPVLTVEQIKMNARATISQGGRVSVIFVDYLTLMKLPKADRHDLSVGEVTKQCKRLAKEIGCVVVLLAQLNRANMQRANKRPINSDLRDAGQIEADADYIFFPYYDLLFNEDSNCGPFAEIIGSKNRHGQAHTTYAKVINGVWMSCDQQEARTRLAA